MLNIFSESLFGYVGFLTWQENTQEVITNNLPTQGFKGMVNFILVLKVNIFNSSKWLCNHRHRFKKICLFSSTTIIHPRHYCLIRCLTTRHLICSREHYLKVVRRRSFPVCGPWIGS